VCVRTANARQKNILEKPSRASAPLAGGCACACWSGGGGGEPAFGLPAAAAPAAAAPLLSLAPLTAAPARVPADGLRACGVVV
jgi:hypothetical protein